jgi:hypothetical protein
MIPDPIVEEVRSIRDDIAKECDYDIDRIFEELRRLEATSTAPHVSLSPRKILESDQQEAATLRGAAQD